MVSESKVLVFKVHETDGAGISSSDPHATRVLPVPAASLGQTSWRTGARSGNGAGCHTETLLYGQNMSRMTKKHRPFGSTCSAVGELSRQLAFPPYWDCRNLLQDFANYGEP